MRTYLAHYRQAILRTLAVAALVATTIAPGLAQALDFLIPMATNTAGTYAQAGVNYWGLGQTFTVDYEAALESISIYNYAGYDQDDYYHMSVYEWSGSGTIDPDGAGVTLLASSASFNVKSWYVSGGPGAWHSITMTTHPTLEIGKYYFWLMVHESGSKGIMYYRATDAAYSDGGTLVFIFNYSTASPSGTDDFAFTVVGKETIAGSLKTNAAVIGQYGDVKIGGTIQGYGTNTRTSPFIQYTLTSGLYTEGNCETIYMGHMYSKDGVPRAFSTILSGIPAEVTVYYRAGATWSDLTTTYGSELSFELTEEQVPGGGGTTENAGVTLERAPDSQTKGKNGWKYAMLVGSADPGTTDNITDIYIQWTTDQDGWDEDDVTNKWDYLIQGGGDELDEPVTFAHDYQVTPSMYGKIYHYRALLVSGGSLEYGEIEAISNTVSIRIHDPTKTDLVNTLDDWLTEWFGDAAFGWWVLAGILIAAGFLTTIVIAFKQHQHGDVGALAVIPLIAASIIASTMLIMVDTSNLWLIGLLSLAGGGFALLCYLVMRRG